jgi:hypothetical protein
MRLICADQNAEMAMARQKILPSLWVRDGVLSLRLD